MSANRSWEILPPDYIYNNFQLILQNRNIIHNLEKMNTLKTTLLMQGEQSSKHLLQKISNIDMLIFQRYLSTTHIRKTRRGAGKEQGRMTADAINKMVENEKKGIFRQLDIGLPQQWREKKKIDDRVVVKASPRYVLSI